jgi:putative transposase
MRTGYPTDLTDAQWELLQPHLPPLTGAGAPRTTNFRSLINAYLYRLKTGCQWRMIPNDFGIPWETVYDYFQRWTRDGIWDRINSALVAKVRIAEGRPEETPSAACIDSQSVKGSETTENSGYDGGKKIKGRKRHIVTDTLGLLLVVLVTSAKLDDGAAASLVMSKMDPKDYPRLAALFADQKYHNHEFEKWLREERPGLRLEISLKDPEVKGFTPLRKRWVVERTLSWLGRNRCLSKEYERKELSSEAWVKLSSIKLMLNRLDDKSKSMSV